MSAKKRIKLLVFNDPYPMRINRELAVEIGLDESILLLQIEYLIGISNTEEHDGNLWTYQSLRKLRKDYFTFWSTAKISRIIKSLEEKELIKVGNFNKHGYDRTQWFALNPKGIEKLTSIQIDTGVFQNEKCIRTKCKMDLNKVKNALPQDETTIPENTPETPPENPSKEYNNGKDEKNEGEAENGSGVNDVVVFLSNLNSGIVLDGEPTEAIANHFTKQLVKFGKAKVEGYLEWAAKETEKKERFSWLKAMKVDVDSGQIENWKPTAHDSEGKPVKPTYKERWTVDENDKTHGYRDWSDGRSEPIVPDNYNGSLYTDPDGFSCVVPQLGDKRRVESTVTGDVYINEFTRDGWIKREVREDEKELELCYAA